MTKQVHSIAIAVRLLPFGMVLLIGMQTAQAKECSAAMPSHPQGHWSYRLIDGRKCWYEGENNFPKSLLQWPEQNSALSAFGKAERDPKEQPLAPVTQTERLRAESNNLPDFESFEARWRAVESTLSGN